MYRATTTKRIDGVFTTLNVINPNTSIISAGTIIGRGDAIIDGDLTVNGTLTTGMTIGAIPATSVTFVPTTPLTGVNVQLAIDELGGLVHTQNTDTILAEGTPLETGVDIIHSHINQYTELINTIGGISIPFTGVDVPFDTQSFITPGYTHMVGSPSITINQDGVYKIDYKVSTVIISGTHRVNTQIQLELDSGSGFVCVPGSISYTNNRTTGSGSSSATNTSFVTVTTGNSVKLVCNKTPVHMTTSIVEIPSNTSSIHITRMN